MQGKGYFYALKLSIVFKIVCSCYLSLGGNLDFLPKKFFNIHNRSIFIPKVSNNSLFRNAKQASIWYTNWTHNYLTRSLVYLFKSYVYIGVIELWVSVRLHARWPLCRRSSSFLSLKHFLSLTHAQEVVGSNPNVGYWMDITFFTLICWRNCKVFVWKRPKINEKEAGDGPLKKTFSKLVVI